MYRIRQGRVGQAATFIVAASDSPRPEHADYVCDGVADQVTIQEAINACPDVTTGIVSEVVLDGTFNIDDTIIIDRPVALSGLGMAHRTPFNNGISLADNSDCDMIDIKPPTGEANLFFPKIINLKLYGNSANQSSGCGIVISPRTAAEGTSDAIIKDCFINRIKDHGIKFLSGWHCHIDNNWLESIGSNGITGYYATVDKCNENYIRGNIIQAKNGINIGADQAHTDTVWRSTIISDNMIDCTDSGVILGGVEGLNLTNNCFGGYQGMDNAIYLTGTAITPIKGVNIINNTFIDATWGTTGAITSIIKYHAGAHVDGLNIFNNNFANTAGTVLTDLGATSLTNVFIRNNNGYVTENSGTATLANGTTSIAVTHGLAVTPAPGDIVVTPIEAWGNMTQFYIDTYTSTQFTIHANINPGQDVDFVWKAIVL